jgi:hypothetical protein
MPSANITAFGPSAAPLLASSWYGRRRTGLLRLRRLTRGGRG